MKKFIFLLLLCLLSILTVGCQNAKQHEEREKPVNGNTSDGRIETRLAYEQKDHKVSFKFQVKNQTGHAVTYHFPTTQRYDFKIKDTSGKVVKHFSEGRFFGQMTGTLTLEHGETKAFETEVSDLKPGQYTITFWLTAAESQPSTTINFKVK
ncbi:hypothetical protein JOD45_001408 [Scopulibacillus daqui]|uniref:Intracellular proteinase inhibitor BsuPI domain-containing protein n=1 Tax=Scopulibacillus daqui TaxID=1469162 RepID=A0ABS2PYU6_9BACL|nr:BsuPI-related putative proteinase inhibitor [Scopulibacillus daqui]MBM7645197.1 hypothetical protein [Scopulibacillus daqui]